jgi:hypothetical protein
VEIVIPFRAVFKVFLYFNNSSKWSEFSFAFSFQFFTRLAAVFAEEVGDFGLFASDGPV